MERSRRVPLSWQPNLQHVGLARDLRVDFALELEKFRDHEYARPYSDWDAVFRNWIRKAAEVTPRNVRRDAIEEAIAAYKATRAAAAERREPPKGPRYGTMVLK